MSILIEKCPKTRPAAPEPHVLRTIRVVACATLARNAHFVLQKRVLLESDVGFCRKRRHSAAKRSVLQQTTHQKPNRRPPNEPRARKSQRNCSISPCFTMKAGRRKQFYPHKYTPGCQKRQFRRRVMKLFRRNEQFYPHKYTPVCQNVSRATTKRCNLR